MRGLSHERPAGVASADAISSLAVNPRRDIRRAMLFGISFVCLLFGTVGLWAATAPLAGAVIASGTIVVESNSRRIQHLTGGIISDIRVRDGDRVKRGDVLVQLDDTLARTSLALIEIQLRDLQARRARLKAERDGKAEISIPPELLERIHQEAGIVEAVESEKSLFRARRVAADVRRSQLRERILQSREEIGGLAAQIEAKRKQEVLIRQEIESVQDLYDNRLAPLSRLTALQREASRLTGEKGALISNVAQVKGRIAEVELQISQIDDDLRREVVAELRDVEGRIADLLERRVAARDQLARVEIRAPQAGIVHQLKVHTIGGVVSPGEDIMLLVPATDELVIEARIDPAMIDRLNLAQSVVLRFPAFDRAETPDLRGQIIQISADTAIDQQTGVRFYIARIALKQIDARRLKGRDLRPGMPVEVFIQTGMRTALTYLLKPIEDQLARSFRYD